MPDYFLTVIKNSQIIIEANLVEHDFVVVIFCNCPKLPLTVVTNNHLVPGTTIKITWNIEF